MIQDTTVQFVHQFCLVIFMLQGILRSQNRDEDGGGNTYVSGGDLICIFVTFLDRSDYV